jgi:hypothetical protein
MKIHLITFASDRYVNRKQYFENIVSKIPWFDTVKVYNNLDIDLDFRKKFADILAMPRGGGYWIWKSHIIQKRLEEIQQNDILIYCDAGCEIQHNSDTEPTFQKYIQHATEHDAVHFELGHQEYKWTNKQTILFFKENYNLTKEHVLSNQIMSTVKILKKSKRTEEYISEFLKILDEDKFLITDEYNPDSISGFRDHRHDQSIFSLLTKALNYGKIIPDETWYEDWSKTTTSPIVAVRATD